MIEITPQSEFRDVNGSPRWDEARIPRYLTLELRDVAQRVCQLVDYLAPTIIEAKINQESVGQVCGSNTVTLISEQIETTLKPKLLELMPGSVFIGGETIPKTIKECQDVFNAPYVWAVTPIDGAANFTNGLAIYAISVGLLRNSNKGLVPILGAVSLPDVNELICSEGIDVYLRSHDKRLQITSNSNDFGKSQAIFLGPDASIQNLDLSDRSILPNIRVLGSEVAAIVYAAIGRGATITASHPWEMAAGFAIAKQLDVHFFELQTGAIKEAFTLKDFYIGGSSDHLLSKRQYIVCNERSFPRLSNNFRVKISAY